MIRILENERGFFFRTLGMPWAGPYDKTKLRRGMTRWARRARRKALKGGMRLDDYQEWVAKQEREINGALKRWGLVPEEKTDGI